MLASGIRPVFFSVVSSCTFLAPRGCLDRLVLAAILLRMQCSLKAGVCASDAPICEHQIELTSVVMSANLFYISVGHQKWAIDAMARHQST